MTTINKVILVGFVAADPEVRYLDRGQAIATFRLATTDPGFTTPSGAEVPERVEWHNIVLWRQLAEWAEKNVKKDMLLHVEGKLQTRRWERDGVSHYKTEIVAETAEIIARPQAEPSRQPEPKEPLPPISLADLPKF